MSEREFVVGPWRKFVIGKNTDMSEEMQQYAVDCAKQALEKYNNGEDFDDVADIANFIGKAFDKKYNPTWAWSRALMIPDRTLFGEMLLENCKRFEWNHIHFAVVGHKGFDILLYKRP